MHDLRYLLLSIAVMAGTTYLIRMLPLTLFRKKITHPFLRSFLFYIPYAVLAAMTVPAIFSSTASPASSAAGLLAALLTAGLEKGLLPVALAACAAVFLTELFL